MIYSDPKIEYSVLDLGYNSTLTKALVGLQGTTPELSNVFTSGVAPRTLIAGELITALEQQAGVIFSGKTAFDNTQIGYRTGIDSDGLVKHYLGTPTNYFNFNGIDVVISGSLSAAKGTLGSLTIASGGHIKSGKTGFTNTENGFILGLDSADNKTKFMIGTPTEYLNIIGDTIVNTLKIAPYVAGTAVLLSTEVQRNTTSTTFTKLKEVTVGRAGSYNLLFEVLGYMAAGVGADWELRKGTDVIVQGSIYGTYTHYDTRTLTGVVPGNVFSLWCRLQGAGADPVGSRYFDLKVIAVNEGYTAPKYTTNYD